jgi:hypothetical protein
MDQRRFDDLAKHFATTLSRRGVLRGVATGLLAGVFGRTAVHAQDSDVCPTKVGICHATGSATNPYRYVEVCTDAVSAHAAHGDLVACPNQQVLDPATCACVCPVASITCPPGQELDAATCACQATSCGTYGDEVYFNPACTTAERPYCCLVTGQCVDENAILYGEECCRGTTACAPGEECCYGGCRPPEFFLSNPANCGGCAVAEDGEQRVQFICGVRPTYDEFGQIGGYENAACCNATCAYLSDDINHCGACGNACQPGDQCINGGCVAP